MKTSVKITKVASKIASSNENKEEIKAIIGIDEFTYFFQKVDAGRAFLDLHFPKGGEFEKYYYQFRDDEYFWAWWNLQWTNHESKILKYFREFPETYDELEWRMQMDCIQDSNDVNDSFHHNYIKKLH